MFFEKNILPINLIKEIKNFVDGRQPDTNNYSFWDNSIIKDSARVDIFHLSETPFKPQIIESYKNFISNTYSECFINFYKWLPGSYIPFHSDGAYGISSTIYLNEHWDKNYGGLFLYEKSNEIKVFTPKYNWAVISDNQLPHSTSIISPKAPIRETLQIFFK